MKTLSHDMTTGKSNKPTLEQHYTPAKLAERWGLSDDFVRELFRHEEGVMVIERPERMHKRGYMIIRIPESVAERVHARLVARGRPTSVAARPGREDERRA